MGENNVVPLLGSASKIFFPIVLVLLIIFNIFDLQKKIFSTLGLKQFEFSDSF
jgi:hypothetical protein